jgi:hypothetical protein
MSPSLLTGALAGGVVPCRPDAARQAAPVAALVAARQATRRSGADAGSRHGAAISRVPVLPRSPRHTEVRP